MNDKKKNTVKNILLTGSIVAGSVLGLSSLNAANVETFKYSELGSGGELRSELLKRKPRQRTAKRRMPNAARASAAKQKPRRKMPKQLTPRIKK